ncbi:MAG: 30S ribosomal protein S19e [Candidatus Pacearchaeota archaeon]|nr:MAG: 30S ribosomal protein S19e [Candidatus Pacearchaeota archaeon]
MAKIKKITLREIPAEVFIEALATRFKAMDEFKMPDWATFVKTGMAKMRPPERDDWWYIRAASILRAVYLSGVVGVSRLRVKYGSRKERGARPKKFYNASGKIIRTILQQGTKAGFIEHIKEKRTGRKLTKKGKEFLEALAAELKK